MKKQILGVAFATASLFLLTLTLTVNADALGVFGEPSDIHICPGSQETCVVDILGNKIIGKKDKGKGAVIIEE